MTAAFTSRLPELEATLAQALPAAVRAMGETAVQAVRTQMMTGYTRPVYNTGALHADVRCRAEGASVIVGNTLPYAPAVHDGTARMAARPYLQDGLPGGAEAMQDVSAQVLAVILQHP